MATDRKLYMKTYRRRIKQRVLDIYGNSCACCGETRFEFLTLDHINGGGREHRDRYTTDTPGRSRGRGGWVFYLYLLKEPMKDLNIQVLCGNCNMAKGQKSVCPHQMSREQAKADWESLSKEEQEKLLTVA